MGRLRINIEVETDGEFPSPDVTAIVNAEATLADGRVGSGQHFAEHPGGPARYNSEDLLQAIAQALASAKQSAPPADVDSYTRYTPESVNYGDGPEGAIATTERNWQRLQEIDQQQREKGELVGRYVTHPIADGQAVYQITSVNGAHATIKVCRGLGDDWTIPAWGEQATINRQTVEELVTRRDGMAALFAKRR